MSGAELAALITAVGVSIASIMTAIAALINARNNAAIAAARIDALEKENKDKTEHNEFQDAVIFNQQRKLDQWSKWGDRVGRKMNEMELQIGYQRRKPSKDDTQPIPPNKDWITGRLGPIDVKDLQE